MMSPDMHACAIAVAQTTPIPADVAANVAQHIQLAHAAADAHADVLVFPELSLTGYELERCPQLAFSTHDARLASLTDIAAERELTLVVGAPLRYGSRLHIAAFIITADRRIDVYTKHHLGAFGPAAARDGMVPPPEAALFQPGALDPLVNVAGNAAAIAVCADVGKPTHAQSAAQRGARAYLAAMFVIPSEWQREVETLRRYAVTHTMLVAFANYGAPTGGLAAAGRSAIWSPRGETLCQLEREGAGIAVAYGDDSGWCGQSIMLAPA